MTETHKPDVRLEVDVAADVVILSCKFVGWPTPQASLIPSLHCFIDQQQYEEKATGETSTLPRSRQELQAAALTNSQELAGR